MPYNPIENGESGLDTRNAINSMFQELYNSIPTPIKLQGESGNFQVTIPANTKLVEISMVATAGGPTVRIGTTPNGQDICPDIPIGADPQDIEVNKYFAADTIIYFTLSGLAGTLNARIGVLYDYF